MIQLGFSGRILSQPRLMTYDRQRAAARPHLSVSLLYLRDVLAHLQRNAVHFYRLPMQLAPYLTHPELPQFHDQIAECAADLALLGEQAREHNLRLSLHLPSSVVLSTPDAGLAARSLHEIEMHAALLQAIGTANAVMVAHIGGAYTERAAALGRCVERIMQLSPRARSLLAIEPDGRVWSLVDGLHIHAQTATPVIFDHLHHQLYDPHQIAPTEALGYALATWPSERRPKVHFSSPRTELRISSGSTGRPHLQAPTWYEHSDFAHPFELIAALRLPAIRPYDLMLEAKAGDLALFRAREDIARFAPDVVERVH